MAYIIIGILIVVLFAVIFFINKNKSSISPEVLNAAAEGFVKVNLIGLINLISACYCSLKNTEDVLTDEEFTDRLIDYAYITVNELSAVYDIDISCLSKIPKENIKDAIFDVYNKYKYLIINLEQGETVVEDSGDYMNMYVLKANSYKESVEDFIRNSDPLKSDEEPEESEFDSENYM